MPHYIRAYVPGGSYFFTVALLERHRCLLTEHVAALRAAFVSVRRQRPFHIDAIVILPDHLHGLWTLPPNDADYSTRWRSIEASFARTIAPGERLSERRRQKSERGIWQLEYARAYQSDLVEGRWVIEARHQGQPWEIIMEPDESERLLVVITACPVSR